MIRTLKERVGLPRGEGKDLPPGPPGFLSAYPGYESTALLDQLKTGS